MAPPYGASLGRCRPAVPMHPPRSAPPSYSSRCMPPADAGHPPADSFAAVLFDLDGVLTPTADVHTTAWTEMFDEFLVAAAGLRRRSATTTTSRYVDGKPRFDGVRVVPRVARHRAARRAIPPTRPGQGPSPRSATARTSCSSTSCAATASPRTPGRCGSSTTSTDAGTPIAVVSSSRNAREVLVRVRPGAALRGRHRRHRRRRRAHRRQAGARHVPRRGHAGSASRRPTPSSSRTRSRASPPGGPADFGLVVGVDRGAGADALREHGADVVVDDLDGDARP